MRIVRALVVSLLATGLVAASAFAEVTAAGRLKISQLVKKADELDRSGDPIAAWLNLSEAERLEQLWSGNTLGEEGPAARARSAYAGELVKREDGDLSKVLHSPRVTLNDKLNLLSRLEDDVILNYAGTEN